MNKHIFDRVFDAFLHIAPVLMVVFVLGMVLLGLV